MEILRYASFTTVPHGGNPAGVVLDASGVDGDAMLAVAKRVGYSETAFVFPQEDGSLRVRYFSPLVEVPFCGHATIALAVAYAQRNGVGNLRLVTEAGPVSVSTGMLDDGSVVATLVSVSPKVVEIQADDLEMLLCALGWNKSDLDPACPPKVAYAGAWHPIIVVSTRVRLAALDYDMELLGQLMAERGWATVNLVWRETDHAFHARNPFPPGGVVEDPATGAAAAALGGYLRHLGLIDLPASLTVFQGEDMGRPGVIKVQVPDDLVSGIEVTGTAVAL